jgi:hypothetical protein
LRIGDDSVSPRWGFWFHFAPSPGLRPGLSNLAPLGLSVDTALGFSSRLSISALRIPNSCPSFPSLLRHPFHRLHHFQDRVNFFTATNSEKIGKTQEIIQCFQASPIFSHFTGDVAAQ